MRAGAQSYVTARLEVHRGRSVRTNRNRCRGSGAADAVLTVREEGGRSGSGRKTEAAGSPKESPLTQRCIHGSMIPDPSGLTYRKARAAPMNWCRALALLCQPRRCGASWQGYSPKPGKGVPDGRVPQRRLTAICSAVVCQPTHTDRAAPRYERAKHTEALIFMCGEAVSPHQQLTGRMYLVGMVIAAYLLVGPLWIGSSLYRVCSRLLGAPRKD